MPREWGRDPFYTFMPRERNEGLGDVHAWMAKSTYTKKQFKTSLAFGYYKLPDVKQVALNKYGFPSYMQVNYEAAYSFSKALKNLGVRMLLVCKKNDGETYDNLKYVYNKVDMFQVNVMIDYNL
ncbi:hypothetical protein EMGBS15_14750 [Filimonas sp.]|nr:hypothetical protein EMGBS15_14750 [Filimonas sp.]